jgi:hypothetical protein
MGLVTPGGPNLAPISCRFDLRTCLLTGSVANFYLSAVRYMIRPLVLRGMMTIEFKGSHEEMMEEHGVAVDHPRFIVRS